MNNSNDKIEKAINEAFEYKINNNELFIDDPTNLGLQIVAKLSIVPGKDGQGAYIGVLDINTPDMIGSCKIHTDFFNTEEEARQALKKEIQKPRTIQVSRSVKFKNKAKKIFLRDRYSEVPLFIQGMSPSGIHLLEAGLVYTGSWDQFALQRMRGYDREKHALIRHGNKKLSQNLAAAWQHAVDETSRIPKFGDGPPVPGQWIAKKEVPMIPGIVDIFGPFKVVLKWAMKPRQVISAMDFYRNYDRITKGAEVRSGDYLREVWVALEDRE